MTDPAEVQKRLVRDFVRGGGKELDLTRYFHLLRRNLWLIAVIMVVVLSGTFAWLNFQPRQYASRTIVQVENEQQKVLGNKVEDVQPQNLITDDYFNTVAQSFASETVMLRVARSVGLDKDPTIFPRSQTVKVTRMRRSLIKCCSVSPPSSARTPA